jgi:hypothetical protein
MVRMMVSIWSPKVEVKAARTHANCERGLGDGREIADQQAATGVIRVCAHEFEGDFDPVRRIHRL